MASAGLLATLEEAVYARPGDDAPRAVYADALLAAGDPRGELIQLQLLPARNEAHRAREQALLARHGKAWLGPLQRVLLAYRFERGFLAVANVTRRKPKAVAALVGHPMWQTAHEVSGAAAIALHPSLRALRVLDLTSFEKSYLGERRAWRAVLVDTPRPIEKLVCPGPSWDPREGLARDELEALCTCAVLPGLRALAIVCTAGEGVLADALATAPVCARLASLELDVANRAGYLDQLTRFGALIEAAPVPRLTLVVGAREHPTRLELERGPRGYARARVAIGPAHRVAPAAQARFRAQGEAIVAALPASVERIAIEPRDALAPAVVAALRALAAAR